MVVEKNIILKKYQWFKYELVYVTGFVWIDNQLFNQEKFAKYIFEKATSSADFIKTLKLLNGQFSVVVEKEGEVWAATSYTWSYPLFFHQQKNKIVISDEPGNLLQGISNPEVDSLSKNYFLLFGVTPQNRTLIQQIEQIKPGEALVWNGTKNELISFFSVVGEEPGRKVTEEEFQQNISLLFEKYFNFFKNKQVLLPLTSGYDSRFLACLLKEFGHENVLCATWGREGNAEVEPAQKVARQLGFAHIFVEYNSELISGFSKKETFPEYIRYAGHLSSMPFLQDYFAIDYLKKNEIIADDTVVMPGHSGFFAGSQLEEGIKTSNNKYLLSKIIDKYGSSFPLNSKSVKEVKEFIEVQFFGDKNFKPWQNFEEWDFQERQCKFISNSNQAWNYFGQDVMMPLFDKQFIDFFKQVSFSQKQGANFYATTLKNKYFTPHKVNFNLKNKAQPKRQHNYLKDLVFKGTPKAIKNMYYPMEDNIFYREITSELIRSMPKSAVWHPVKPHKYNSYIIQWYLQYIKENLS